MMQIAETAILFITLCHSLFRLYNVVALQVVYTITRKAAPNGYYDEYWKQTIKLKYNIHQVIHERNRQILLAIVVFLVSFIGILILAIL
ncbi:MAG TPA: hypothetical protein VL443_08090 [Cyclobacteriaceae bacterium]|jgi:hypothetical protein|nr:hypothetical protein [Cyclobacteriaceae bacterium]